MMIALHKSCRLYFYKKTDVNDDNILGVSDSYSFIATLSREERQQKNKPARKFHFDKHLINQMIDFFMEKRINQ